MKYRLTDLAVPVVDTDGRHLGLSTEPTSHVAVASLCIGTDAFSATLDVLAASHRVTVEVADTTVTETVACDVAGSDRHKLPVAHTWDSGAVSVSFESSMQFGGPALADATEAIARLDGSRSIVVRFPGHDAALTAIELIIGADLGWPAWRTWHLYPGDDPHVVTTKTTTFDASRAATHAVVDLQGVS